MKKISILTLLSWACCILPSFSQYLTFADTNASWSEENRKYFAMGDTVIGANTYAKYTEIFGTNTFVPPTGPIDFLLRSETNGKTWWRNNGNDYLICDMSVNIGDTGTVYNIEGGAGSGGAHFTVQNISSVFIAGATRKMVWLSGDPSPYTERWIEGFGTYGDDAGTFGGPKLMNAWIKGVIIDWCFTSGGNGIPPDLLCYRENNTDLWINPSPYPGNTLYVVDSCFRVCTLGNDEFSKDQFKIYPNPASEWMNISGLEHDDYAYVIINAFGQEMKSQLLTASYSKIDISTFSPGIYFLVITDRQTNKKAVLKFSRTDR